MVSLASELSTHRSIFLEHLPLLFTWLHVSFLRSRPLSNNPPWLGEVILLYDSVHPVIPTGVQ